ncbi:MAG TPA: ABC transporter permease [Tianweitania sediminis]|jgi:putative hydroxymethylpyrimidine transport system permease protein|nr:ABC transporter permease [Tianweitania sediminis]
MAAFVQPDSRARRSASQTGVVAACLAVLRGAASVVLAWQAAVWLFSPPRYMLPAPLDVLFVFEERGTFLLHHAGITLVEIGLGLFFGTLAGATTAIVTAALPRTGQLIWPFVLVAQALPVFAIAPLLVLWFGLGLASKVVMTSLIIFFPVASAFSDGLRRTDQHLLDDCAMTPATHWQTLRHVRLPLALPGLVSGLRMAAPLAPLGAVVGEWVGASGGLGFIMLQANARMRTAEVFAALIILALLVLVLRAAVDAATVRLVPWAAETAA